MRNRMCGQCKFEDISYASARVHCNVSFKKISKFLATRTLDLPIIGWKWIDRGRTSRHPRIDLQRRSQSDRCAAVTSLLTEQYGAKNPVSRNLGRLKRGGEEKNEIPTSVS